jgi:hypothetical protein
MPRSRTKAARVQKKKAILNGVSQRMKRKTTAKINSPSTKDKIEQGKKKIVRLISNARNKQIKLVNVGNRKAFCVQFDGTGKEYIYSGLTKKLARVFYPDLEEDPKKRSKNGPEAERAKVKGPYYKPANMVRTCLLFGKEHGERVHAEMQYFTDCMVHGKGVDEFYRGVKDPDPCTLRFICCLDKKGWIPIVSELQIWDEDLRIATSIDLIALDLNTGKVILLELKTGYEGESYGPLPNDPKFPKPLDSVTNCPMFRHMLQLLVTDMILRKKYNVALDEMYILRTLSKDRCTHKIEPPVWCTKKLNRDNIYTILTEAE